MSTYRPRRSVLYMPGANERALEKAKDIPADALILDLEDAVSPDAKAEARDRVCSLAHQYGKKEVAIRVNGIGTEWHEADIAAVAAAGPSAMLVPKVNSAAEVQQLVAALEKNGAPATMQLWAMLETPMAIMSAYEIASASPRLGVLVMGTNDLVKELAAEHVPGRAPLLYALQTCIMATRLAGKTILDGVFNDIKDDEGFANECRQARSFGFDGKTLIHPSQVDPCNAVFAPSADEIDHSRRVIEAFAAAQAEGRGVVTVDGRMIENLHVETAQRILAIQEAIEANR
ncbi:MAG: hypothetical protein RLZZ31_1022 [Actinomycetota bacterium]